MTEFAIFEQFNLNNRIRIINPFITSCIVLLKSGQRMCLQYTTEQCPALFVQRQIGAHNLFIRTERRVPLSCRSFWKRGCECMPWCPGWPLLLSAIVAALVHQLATNTRRSTQHKYVHVGPIIPLFICAQPAIRLRLLPLLIRHVLLHTWLHKRGSVKQERINSMYQKSQWTIFHPPRRNRRRWRTKGQPSSSSTSTTTVLFARILHRFFAIHLKLMPALVLIGGGPCPKISTPCVPSQSRDGGAVLLLLLLVNSMVLSGFVGRTFKRRMDG